MNNVLWSCLKGMFEIEVMQLYFKNYISKVFGKYYVLYLRKYDDMIFYLYDEKSIIYLIILSKLLFKIYIYYILLIFVS